MDNNPYLAVNKLKSLINNKISQEEVQNLLRKIRIPCISFKLSKGEYVIRARKGKGFKKRSEMTYCPVERCTFNQRASLPSQTMFYGVVSDSKNNLENARLVAVSECSTLCRQGKKSVGRETFCISLWEVVKPLNLVSFITPSTFKEVPDNFLLNQLRDAYIYCKNINKFTDADEQILEFISNEFCKPVKPNSHEQYIISATIASDIINDTCYDGIVYPSVKLSGQGGLNIALSPKAVNNKLKFFRILEQTFYKNGKHGVLRIEYHRENGITNKINQISDEAIAAKIKVKKLCNLTEVQ